MPPGCGRLKMIIRPTILIAEDDPDDQLLLQTAFLENGEQHKLNFVGNGVDLLFHLNNINDRIDGNEFPDFIMLDLNMPRKNGRETLQDIKQHPVFRKIPVIIYTTTRDEREIKRCYELGANTYIVKPANFESMVKMVGIVLRYWCSTASIPARMSGAD